MKKKNKIIIFDLDGVLVNSMPNMRKALNLTSKKVNIKLSFKKYKKFLGLPFEKILQKMKIKNNYKEIKKYYEFYSLKYIDKIRIKKIFLKELKMLKKEYFLAIFTSKSKKRTKKIISKYKIFDDCLTIDDVKKGKPMPEGLLKILKKFKINKKKAVFIGDSIYDYECAKKANILYLHAKWGYERSNKTKKFININNFTKIRKFL